MSLAFLFPGQGSQAVGMGADLADAFGAAREVFQEVDDALGQKLFKLMREGPEDQLTLTENAQPALMAVSLAVMRVLEKEFGVGVEKAAEAAGATVLPAPELPERAIAGKGTDWNDYEARRGTQAVKAAIDVQMGKTAAPRPVETQRAAMAQGMGA